MDEVLRDVLRQCVEQGMQPPLILCVVSPNGSTMVMRTDGEHPEILAEHTEGAGFSTPINCMVVDRAGAAAHITIEPSGATAFHQECRTPRALMFRHRLPGSLVTHLIGKRASFLCTKAPMLRAPRQTFWTASRLVGEMFR